MRSIANGVTTWDTSLFATPLDRSTVDERIAMMWSLAKDARFVAGKPIANYERKDMPGAMVPALSPMDVKEDFVDIAKSGPPARDSPTSAATIVAI